MEIKKTITVILNKCNLCGYEWESRKSKPKQCPDCKRQDWNKERKK